MRDRITREKATVELMIRLYCKYKEGNPTLCPTCTDLLDYAQTRLSYCHFGTAKPTCRKCPIHCYNPTQRARIQAVMRWAGPRMILYHPVAAIRHLWGEVFHHVRYKGGRCKGR